MKKNNTFPNLIQKIISKEELTLVKEITGYQDTARKLDILTLVQNLVSTAANEWKSFRHCADVSSTHSLRQHSEV